MSRLMLSCAMLLASALGNSCSGASAVEGSGDGAQTAQQVDQHAMDAFIRDVEANLLELRSGGATEGQLSDGLRQAFATGEHLDELQLDAPHREALTRLYEERSYRPIFVEQQHLNYRGIVTAETLIKAHRHALDPTDFHAAELRSALSGMRERQTAETQSDAELSTTQREQLSAWARAHLGSDGTLPDASSTVEAIASGGDDSPLPELSEPLHTTTGEDDQGPLLSALHAELLLADGWLRWARAMRFNNVHFISDEMAAARRWQLEPPTPEDEDEEGEDEEGENQPPEPLLDLTTDEDMAQAATTLAAEHLATALLDEDMETALSALQPPFAQYQRLLDGATRYREYAYEGGWQPLDISVPLSRGSSGQDVLALRARLAAEDYFDGPLDEPAFDDALDEAVEEYQRHHQIRPTGRVDEDTLSSLNVSALERLAQIEVTLERWRNSRIGADHSGEHILINIPDFHGELWDGDELVHRWRTIVGALRRQRQDNGEMRYWGATRLFSDTMHYVVFNPYWNVPGNIWRNEYQPEIEEDPNWLEDNNYEILVNEHGREFLRQRPGPNNALGLVKFLFPNEWDIYLHDTNRPRLFEYDIRAFSHGCIRSQNALELAAILLSRDQGTSVERMRYRINEIIAEGTEQWISLRDPLPIHLEYYVVRGDEDGNIQFLADVYRHDRELVATRVDELQEHFDELRSEDEELRSVRPGHPHAEL